MNTNDTVNKAADSAQNAADRVADKAERTVDSARSYANEALDKTESKVRSLRDEVKPAIETLSAKAADVAERGKAAAAEATAQTREKFNEVCDRTSAYVSEQPLKSMAIAAAAGAALAILMGRRSRY